MYKFKQFSWKNFWQLHIPMKSQPQNKISILSTNLEISIVSLQYNY